MAEFDYSQAPVEARGLKSQFGDHVVHEGLDFDVRQGEILGIVGGSGSGKSVLLNTLLGLKEPDGGEILYYGVDRKDMTKAEWQSMRNQMGVLFQGGALFSSLTVRENIMVPMQEHSDISPKLQRDLADMKIQIVGLPPNAGDLYPSDLSGGMVKRAGLARALSLDPKMLFLDEPTSGLDPIGAAAFDQLLLELRDALGLTVIMITHDLDNLYTTSDRVAVLLHKKIAVEDTLANVMTYDDPWVQEYFNGARGRSRAEQGGG